MTADMDSVLRGSRILPVLTVPDPATTHHLPQALAAGGARCAEVTFRTRAPNRYSRQWRRSLSIDRCKRA